MLFFILNQRASGLIVIADGVKSLLHVTDWCYSNSHIIVTWDSFAVLCVPLACNFEFTACVLTVFFSALFFISHSVHLLLFYLYPILSLSCYSTNRDDRNSFCWSIRNSGFYARSLKLWYTVPMFVTYKLNSLKHLVHTRRLCELVSNTKSSVATTHQTAGPVLNSVGVDVTMRGCLLKWEPHNLFFPFLFFLVFLQILQVFDSFEPCEPF